MKEKNIPDFERFKNIPLALLVTLTFFVPFFFIFTIFLLRKKIKKMKRTTTKIYHFIPSEEQFTSIKDSKCLLSITGGRCYATSMMNPYLGVKLCNKEKVQFLIVLTHNAFKLFKPVISSRKEMFHVWKWWKLYRNEWVSIKKEDIEIELVENKKISEQLEIKRFRQTYNVNFDGYLVNDASNLPSEPKVIKKQKKVFDNGESALSFLMLSAVAFFNLVSMGGLMALFNCPKDLTTLIISTPGFIKHPLIIVYALFALMHIGNTLIAFCSAGKLKKHAIKIRILSQIKKHNKEKLEYYKEKFKF